MKRPPCRAALMALVLSATALAGGCKPEPSKAAPAAPAKAAAPAASAPPASPYLLVSEADGFRVQLPARPEADRTAEGSGPGTDAKWMVVLPTGALMIMVSHCEAELCLREPEGVLKGVRQSALREGKLLNEKQLQLQLGQRSYPCYEYEALSAQGLHTSTRAFVADNRLFQIIYMRLGGSKEIFQQVVDSFSLL